MPKYHSQNHQTPKEHDISPHNKWGIYQLKCNTCGRSYVGQTSRWMNIRFQEHIRYIRNNNPQTAYAQHILKTGKNTARLLKLLKCTLRNSAVICSEQYYSMIKLFVWLICKCLRKYGHMPLNIWGNWYILVSACRNLKLKQSEEEFVQIMKY